MSQSSACVATLATLVIGLAGRAYAQAPETNGFVLAPAAIPVEEILPGGPPRDGIPALSDPDVVSAASAPWHDEEIVIGVARGVDARAYPIALLNWHELVNDTVGGDPVLVSYCPLCGTGMVFDRNVGGTARSFGVSGLLYHSDLLLYDHETESLWSQISSKAVTGPSTGQRLRVVRSVLTSWGEWKRLHPDTTVLSLETGHRRDYRSSPYGDYATSTAVMFPVPLDPRYHPKMPTLGIRLINGPARAYPAQEVGDAGGLVEEEFEGRAIVVRYDADAQTFDVEAPPDVEVIEGYWFAWSAFHPESSVFVASSGAGAGQPREAPGP